MRTPDPPFYSFRGSLVSAARSAVGLSAAPATLARFESVIAPGETKEMADKMATAPGSSTCFLTVSGLWQEAGFRHKLLRPPYLVASAGSRVMAIALEKKALVLARPDASGGTPRPKPGDALLLNILDPYSGSPLARAGEIGHAAIVTDVFDERHVVTADGGAVDGYGRQMIARRERFWSLEEDPDDHDKRKLFDRSQSVESRVSGWIDADKIDPGTTEILWAAIAIGAGALVYHFRDDIRGALRRR